MIPYGPLPTLLHLALAAGLGNTIARYVLYLEATSLLHPLLCHALMHLCVGRGTALAVALVGLMPMVLVPPGTMTGAENASSTLERCGIVLINLA